MVRVEWPIVKNGRGSLTHRKRPCMKLDRPGVIRDLVGPKLRGVSAARLIRNGLNGNCRLASSCTVSGARGTPRGDHRGVGRMLKAREERRKVLVRARMHSGVSWSDVCIVNISSRGLGVQAARPPGRGEYVEIRRGPHAIVGRVVWSKHHRFGISTQDVLFIDAIVNQAQTQAPCATPVPFRERRTRARSANAHDRSRAKGRRVEFALAILGGFCLAGALGGMVQSALARPLVAISAALHPTSKSD